MLLSWFSCLGGCYFIFSVASESTGWSEFAESVSNHGFCNEYRDVILSVVDSKCVSNEFRSNLRSSCPSLYHSFAVAHHLHLFEEFCVDVWSFVIASCHSLLISEFGYVLTFAVFNNPFVVLFALSSFNTQGR